MDGDGLGQIQPCKAPAFLSGVASDGGHMNASEFMYLLLYIVLKCTN